MTENNRTGDQTPGYQALRFGRWSRENRGYHIRFTRASQFTRDLTRAPAEVFLQALFDWQLTCNAALLAFVLMPDHIHLLALLLSGCELTEAVRRLKGRSAREINRALGRKGSVWQPGYFDRQIRNHEPFDTVSAYVENNPVHVGLCAFADEYEYSSANPRFKDDLLGRKWLSGVPIPELDLL